MEENMIGRERIIEELKKNKQWGGQAKVNKELGVSIHIVNRILG